MKQTPQLVEEIEGILTELLIQSFADRVLVLVTQLGKVGSLIQVSIPTTSVIQLPSPDSGDGDMPLPEVPPSVQLTPLIGIAPSQHLQNLHSLYAAQVATLFWTLELGPDAGDGGPGAMAQRRPVILGIALKRDKTAMGDPDPTAERRMFLGVMKAVRKCYQQG